MRKFSWQKSGSKISKSNFPIYKLKKKWVQDLRVWNFRACLFNFVVVSCTASHRLGTLLSPKKKWGRPPPKRNPLPPTRFTSTQVNCANTPAANTNDASTPSPTMHSVNLQTLPSPISRKTTPSQLMAFSPSASVSGHLQHPIAPWILNSSKNVAPNSSRISLPSTRWPPCNGFGP